MRKYFLITLLCFSLFQGRVFAVSSATQFDTDSKLMLHMNGGNLSTTFTDSSASNNTMTANGGAIQSSVLLKFGASAGHFVAATSSTVTTPDSADWDFGTGDFTVDFWVNFNSLVAGTFYDMVDVGCFNYGPRIEYDHETVGSTLYVYIGGNFNGVTTTLSTATWYHIAVIRTGGTVRVFKDGTQVGADWAKATDITGSTAGVTVGGKDDCSGVKALFLDGNIDELRIVKGLAVWTSNFTSPSAEYTVVPGGKSKLTLLGVS